jgi:hypothetical protein
MKQTIETKKLELVGMVERKRINKQADVPHTPYIAGIEQETCFAAVSDQQARRPVPRHAQAEYVGLCGLKPFCKFGRTRETE